MSEDERRMSKLPGDVAEDSLILVNRDHERKKRHTTKGSLPERPKGKHKCNEFAM